MRAFTTLAAPCEEEQVIKKSRFIGRLFPVASEQEAQEKLAAIKKKHWDASHNCSAFVLGQRGELTRCSDDGEPQGTAGVPMLEALKRSGLSNVLAVVTRYFGGTLLGAGGLIRAYTGSVARCIEVAKREEHRPVSVFGAEIPHKLWGKLGAQLASRGFLVRDVEYAQHVRFVIDAPVGREEELRQLFLELSGGQIEPVAQGQQYIILPL